MRILISCGGTGGHIFPGISLYNALLNRQGIEDMLLVFDKREVSSFIALGDYPHIYICQAQIKFNFNLQSLVVVLKLVKGIFQSLKVLLKFRPDVVVGFGGYASFFIIFFARLLGIKAVIHEQNLVPGRANRVLAGMVNQIAISFPETKDYFRGLSAKVKFTGLPLRQSLVKIDKVRAYEFFGLEPGRFTFLVMGGSQGSHKLNEIFFKAGNLFKDSRRFQVIHICGRKDLEFLENGYKDRGIRAAVFPFLKEMQYAYSAADAVISRSGAAAISEIIFFGLPSVLIPYPYAYKHQSENARYLSRNNAAMLIEEKEINPELLKERLSVLLDNPEFHRALGRHARDLFYPEAAAALAQAVLNV